MEISKEEKEVMEVLLKDNIDDGTGENDCPVKWAIVGGITDYEATSTLPEKEDKRIETYIKNIATAIHKIYKPLLEEKDKEIKQLKKKLKISNTSSSYTIEH